jgi:DNA invertase Pin-like site-specific DNA recombinase
VDDFVEARSSAGSSTQRAQLLALIETLQPGDRLMVSELSRLGRSLGQILQIVERLLQRGVRLVAMKEAIRFEGQQNLQTKAMIALFGLFAEVERDLIAERTKEGLAAVKAKGKQLGRPKGALGKSKLDGKEQEIELLLGKQVSKASIARIVEVSPTTLYPDFDTSRYIFPDERRSSLLNCKALRNCRLDTQPPCIDTWIMEIDLTGPISFAYHCIHVSA